MVCSVLQSPPGTSDIRRDPKLYTTSLLLLYPPPPEVKIPNNGEEPDDSLFYTNMLVGTGL